MKSKIHEHTTKKTTLGVRRTIKFLSFALILVVGMIFAFQGCQKETLSEPQNESKYVTKKLTFEDIKSKKELSKPIKLLEEVLDVNAKNKDLPNSFVIETDQILEVSKDNRKTYSFNILNPTDSTSVFENFIIDISDPNQTKYFIFKYKYKDDFNSGEFPFDISANGLSEYQISINNFQINLSKWELCFYEYTVISPRDDPAYDIDMVEWWDCSGSGQGIDMGGDDSDSNSDNGDSDSSSTSNTSSNSGSSGSSSSSSSNDSSSSTTNPSNDTDNPHGPVGVNYDAIDNIASILTNLSDADLAYLETHPSFADKINQFLTQHPNSPNANSFVYEVIQSNMNGSVINNFPFFKYPVGSNYSSQYPRLTEYLKNKIPLLKNNSFIINKLVTYSELTQQKVVNDLTWGKGPTIIISQLDYLSTNTYGVFRSNNPNVLTIDIDLVNMLENSDISPQGNSLAFLLGVTILHEYVHLGDFVDGIDQPGEEGLLFEEATYGETIWLNNAKDVMFRWQH